MAANQAEHVWILLLVGIINAFAIVTTNSVRCGNDWIIEKPNIPFAYGLSILCWLVLIKSDLVQSFSNLFSRLWGCLPILLQMLLWIALFCTMQQYPVIKLLSVSFLSSRGLTFILSPKKQKQKTAVKFLQSNDTDKSNTHHITYKNRELSAIPAVTINRENSSASFSVSTSVNEQSTKPSNLSKIKKEESKSIRTKSSNVPTQPAAATQPAAIPTAVISPRQRTSAESNNNCENDVHRETLTKVESHSSFSQSDVSFEHQYAKLDTKEDLRVKRKAHQITEIVIVDRSKRLLVDVGIQGKHALPSVGVHIGRPQLKRKRNTTSKLTASEEKQFISSLDETLEMKSKKPKVHEDRVENVRFDTSNAESSATMLRGTNQTMETVSLLTHFPLERSDFKSETIAPVATVTSTSAHTQAAPPTFVFAISGDSSWKNVPSSTSTDIETRDVSLPQSKFSFEIPLSTVNSQSKSGIVSGKPPTPSSSQPVKSVPFGIAFTDKDLPGSNTEQDHLSTKSSDSVKSTVMLNTSTSGIIAGGAPTFTFPVTSVANSSTSINPSLNSSAILGFPTSSSPAAPVFNFPSSTGLTFPAVSTTEVPSSTGEASGGFTLGSAGTSNKRKGKSTRR